ncbi:hypothetical protein DDF65_24200 [Caulobacter radicis]|uniref:Uncharacterized protein n=1 Tax=Caulobacter radicis TaxID=2172650 RepID=A0A2T9IWJ4_9CAUL|nr:hypothetical protein DDF65_24200 [Caulobacter radicis]
MRGEAASPVSRPRRRPRPSPAPRPPRRGRRWPGRRPGPRRRPHGRCFCSRSRPWCGNAALARTFLPRSPFAPFTRERRALTQGALHRAALGGRIHARSFHALGSRRASG